MSKARIIWKWYKEAWTGKFTVFGQYYDMPQASLLYRLWITTKLLPMIWKVGR